MVEVEFDEEDKKIEPGKRTAFCVYLKYDAGGTDTKYQDVPFGCTLKKISMDFDTNCASIVVIGVKIDNKVVAKGRGKDSKVIFDLEESIYPNSRVSFELIDEDSAVDWNVLIYGEVVCS